jgi:hypothetical protein
VFAFLSVIARAHAFLSVNPAECCMSYEEDDTGMSYGEEDTCMHSSV